MVDSNNSTHVVLPENVYSDESLRYYIAREPKKFGDSRIPFPTPMLVAAIKNSKDGYVTVETITEVTHSFGNSDASVYPAWQNVGASSSAISIEEQINKVPPVDTLVSDEPTSTETAATTNAHEVY